MRFVRQLTVVGGLFAASAIALAPARAETVPVQVQVPGPYVALRIDVYDGPASADRPTEPASEQRGSGVVVGFAGKEEWFVLTNAHVVDPGDEKSRAVPRVYAGGKWRTGRVVASDEEADLAVLRIRFPGEMRIADLAHDPPGDRVAVETHGFAGGRKYMERASELRRDLPLGGGANARAPRRYFIKTTFAPGESGGAITVDDRLVALIHGNDCEAGWGICVDQPSIAEFLGPYLRKPNGGE